MCEENRRIINSDYVQAFIVVSSPDASYITARIKGDEPTIRIKAYKNDEEAAQAMYDLIIALASDKDYYFMMPSSYHAEEKGVDKRYKHKRHGGS